MESIGISGRERTWRRTKRTETEGKKDVFINAGANEENHVQLSFSCVAVPPHFPDWSKCRPEPSDTCLCIHN